MIVQVKRHNMLSSMFKFKAILKTYLTLKNVAFTSEK